MLKFPMSWKILVPSPKLNKDVYNVIKNEDLEGRMLKGEKEKKRDGKGRDGEGDKRRLLWNMRISKTLFKVLSFFSWRI